MNKINSTTHKGTYESPSIEVLHLVQMMTVCASNGETQNYGSQSIWGTGDDNENE